MTLNGSWTEWKRVPSEVLGERLETVRALKELEHEMYEISKDKETGEHYLHYAYLHRNFKAVGPDLGQEEVFHQLMPLTSDDVLGLLFGEQPYDYPDHWNKPFLRNGPEGDYVWFDPSYAAEEQEHEAMGLEIAQQLAKFKAAGDLSEDRVRELLDKLNKKDGEKKE